MKSETRRFLVILTCAFVGFFVADFAVKSIRNGVDDWRVKRVAVGMSATEAAAATGRKLHVTTNGVAEIWVMEHDSLFDLLVLQKTTSAGTAIRIENGKVVAVNASFILR